MQLNKREVGRQIVHLSGIILVYFIIAMGKDITLAFALAVSTILLLIGIYKGMRFHIRAHAAVRMKALEKAEDIFFDVIDSLDRKGQFPYYGAFSFYLGSALTLALFPAQAALAIAVLAVHDSVSTLVGVHFGRHKLPYNKNKSIEGTASGFVAAFAACLMLTDIFTALIAALAGALIESLPLRLDDNITIPIGVALALSVM